MNKGKCQSLQWQTPTVKPIQCVNVSRNGFGINHQKRMRVGTIMPTATNVLLPTSRQHNHSGKPLQKAPSTLSSTGTPPKKGKSRSSVVPFAAVIWSCAFHALPLLTLAKRELFNIEKCQQGMHPHQLLGDQQGIYPITQPSETSQSTKHHLKQAFSRDSVCHCSDVPGYPHAPPQMGSQWWVGSDL